MNTRRRLSSITLALVLAAACGKPVDPDGKPDQSFAQAGMGTPEILPGAPPPGRPLANRPLANDVSIEVVSWLVSFNRLQTPQALEDALNRKPGQFSRVDADGDGVPDHISVVERASPDGHAFELRTRPRPGQGNPELVVATMMFDKEWGFAGHYDGAVGGAVATVPVVAAAAAAPAPVVAAAPAVVVSPTPPVPAPSVQAVPAGSELEAGLAARP